MLNGSIAKMTKEVIIVTTPVTTLRNGEQDDYVSLVITVLQTMTERLVK